MPAQNPRLIRATTLWFATETTPGVAVTPVGADALKILTGVNVEPDFAMVDREINLPYLGGSPELSSRALLKASGVRVELGASGTNSPAWSPLLRALGFAEAALTTPTRREFTPISTNFQSGTLWAEGAGVLYKSRNALGTGVLDFTVGSVPRLEAELTAVYTSEEAASGPAPDYSAWRDPQIIQPAFVQADVTYGCTYAAGALSGGTAIPSKGLRIEIGNSVNYQDLCTNPFVQITQRSMRATLTLDMSAAQEVAAVAASRAGTTDSMGFRFGTGTGKQFILFAPAVQRMNPRVVDENGNRMISFDLKFTPVNGNDEFRLVLQ